MTEEHTGNTLLNEPQQPSPGIQEAFGIVYTNAGKEPSNCKTYLSVCPSM